MFNNKTACILRILGEALCRVADEAFGSGEEDLPRNPVFSDCETANRRLKAAATPSDCETTDQIREDDVPTSPSEVPEVPARVRKERVKKPVEESTEPLDRATLHARLTKVYNEQGKAAALAVLKRAGYKKYSDIPDEGLPALQKALEEC